MRSLTESRGEGGWVKAGKGYGLCYVESAKQQIRQRGGGLDFGGKVEKSTGRPHGQQSHTDLNRGASAIRRGRVACSLESAARHGCGWNSERVGPLSSISR